MDKNEAFVPSSDVDHSSEHDDGTEAPVTVALLALPETTPASIYGLLEVFCAVGTVWDALTGDETRVRQMPARIVARRKAPFTAAMGVPIAPEAGLRGTTADVIIVSDLDVGPATDPRGRWGEEVAWVQAQHAAGATVATVCTGSVFLAEAGLLDGKEATTHWAATPLFKACYPQVNLRPELVLCPGGPDHRIVTGGGSGSWEELALYLIAQHCGDAEAVRIAKVFLFGDRSDGQLPFAAMDRQRHDDAVIESCQGWIADHYAAAQPVARMVERSGLATRTFKRRFKAATGYTPVDYVQALRVEEAKQILETTDVATDRVAEMIGYEDPAFFRRLFKRRTGVTPGRYRRRFQTMGGRHIQEG